MKHTQEIRRFDIDFNTRYTREAGQYCLASDVEAIEAQLPALIESNRVMREAIERAVKEGWDIRPGVFAERTLKISQALSGDAMKQLETALSTASKLTGGRT